MRWSDCAGLRICCSPTPEDRFSRDEAHIINEPLWVNSSDIDDEENITLIW